jgi:hypothetical protein
VFLENVNARCGLHPRRESHEAEYAAVRPAETNRQLAEILVECHKHSTVVESELQDLLVTGIKRPLAGTDDIMPGCSENGGNSAPDSGVQHDLHGPLLATVKGSKRSLAI